MQMTSKPMLIAISAEQADRLYWLGRYVERVFSTVRIFNQSLDRMIDPGRRGLRGVLQALVDSVGYLSGCRRF